MTKKPETKTEENPQNIWSEEFIKEAASQFESNMAAILGGFSGVPEDQITQEQIASTFSKMAEAAAQVLKPMKENEALPASDPGAQEKIDEVSAAISQTLQNLNTNSESLQTPFSEQDLANMFNNFNLSEGGQDGNMFLPFMQGMMQSLLSKEVLYPSLKELVDKYPDWLRDNKGKLPQEDYERQVPRALIMISWKLYNIYTLVYEKQQSLMNQVCSELEPEQESDPEDVKRKRFEKVLKLMQQMQDLGQPPTDLVGDMAVPPEGFAAPPGQDASQCCVM
ncbi:putative house keepingprotein [Danaus plexippus plexippus]|uniref:Peroxin-19 n=1 Tax=Danaus plexippus plexippus TaxID=278856 RepID=A0A212F1K6_DANPL|nr:putative house keepingprotein [Danaus plexippus plexippus]